MQGSLIVLTGASGAGKTTLARAFQDAYPNEYDVLFFDSVGVPSMEEMKAFGEGHQPGGAWQRATTLQWMKQIAKILQAGRSVLLEGQMRIAFITEAVDGAGISAAKIILVDCADATRATRLTADRGQPELANANMLNWAQYLREEAMLGNHEILDTDMKPLGEYVELLKSHLHGQPETR